MWKVVLPCLHGKERKGLQNTIRTYGSAGWTLLKPSRQTLEQPFGVHPLNLPGGDKEAGPRA
jgi:hypothetical protein